MRRIAILAAAVGGLIASQSFAAFTFNSTRAAINATQDRVNFLVSADTPSISVSVLSVDITAGQANGLKFFVPAVGNPQAYPASDEASYTGGGATPTGATAGNRLTYGGLPFGATTLGTPDPSLAANKPLFQAGLTTINYASFLLSTFTAPTADIGSYVLASAVVPKNVTVTFAGSIRGELNDNSPGANVPFLVVNGIPEPTSLAALAGVVGLVARRRK